MSTTFSDHSKKVEITPDFDPKDTASYWANRWEKGATGWKFGEVHKPFVDNMAKVLEAASKPATDLKAALSGKTVFVPLCGDTYAARFFADQGCDVVGIDIAEASLVAAQQQYFTAEEGFEVSKQQVLDGAVVEYSITKTGGAAGSVRYFAGDIFAVIDGLFKDTVFDVVYDRASLMAMHPSLREQYLAMMHSVFKPTGNKSDWAPVMFLDLAIWPKQLWGQGPPFHIAEPLDEIYPISAGYHFKMIRDCDTELIQLLEAGGDVPAGKQSFSLRDFAVWTV